LLASWWQTPIQVIGRAGLPACGSSDGRLVKPVGANCTLE
jgi:hypothetical protein